MQHLIERVAKHYGFSPERVTAHAASTRHRKARQVLAACLRQRGESFADIAKLLGYTWHSGAQMACRAADQSEVRKIMRGAK